MKLTDYYWRRDEDARWAGVRGYRDRTWRSNPLVEVAFIIRNRVRNAVVGRFAGPNVWFERADAERYLSNRQRAKGYEEDEVVPVWMVQVNISPEAEALARQRAAKHYAARFSKAEDDPHVKVNVDGNWHLFLDDYLDLRGQVMTGKMGPNEARKRQWFREGYLDGRWDSTASEEFFTYTMATRSRMWRERTRWMVVHKQENERNMRPGQTVTNMELVKQEFVYIDKMLEDFYVAHFTGAEEKVASSVRHALGCEVAEKLSDVCTCAVEHKADCPILNRGTDCTCGAWDTK